MWIVKNTLRGILRFPGLDISIPPYGEFDLDILPRQITENSNQIKVAFEEGYLENVRKDPVKSGGGEVAISSEEQLEQTLTKFKNKIIEEIKQVLPALPQASENQTLIEKIEMLKKDFSGDMEQLVKSVESIRDKIRLEKSKVLDDQRLSGAELRARLKFLEEKEAEINTNFERLGIRSTSLRNRPDDKGLMEKADILSDL
ncbi:MAG: hypothetical protein D6805_07955 [Planctomycetota bacterium]|nr:MAG: hypothetical protein D6805_07955 [Planctomycetota bacterium]